MTSLIEYLISLFPRFIRNFYRRQNINVTNYNVVYRATTYSDNIELIQQPIIYESEECWLTTNQFIRDVLIESNEVQEVREC